MTYQNQNKLLNLISAQKLLTSWNSATANLLKLELCKFANIEMPLCISLRLRKFRDFVTLAGHWILYNQYISPKYINAKNSCYGPT